MDINEENFASTMSEKNAGFLIRGFSVIDGKIICDATQENIQDATIDALDLNIRTYNCLYRNRCLYLKYNNNNNNNIKISDLLILSQDDLIKMPYIGKQAIDEIITKITQYLLKDPEKRICSISPEYAVINNVITHLPTNNIINDINIDYLGWRAHILEILHQGNIKLLSELIQLTKYQMDELPGMTYKLNKEIIDFVLIYLKSNQFDPLEKNIQINNELISISIDDIPDHDSDIPILASDYVVIGHVICNYRTYKIIPDAPVEILNLSQRSLNILFKNGNTMISSLIGMPYNKFRAMPKLGIISANEIHEKLEQYLDVQQQLSKQEAVLDENVSETEILTCLKKNKFMKLELINFVDMLPNAKENDLIITLDKLVNEGKIIKIGNAYTFHYESFFTYIQNIANTADLNQRSLRIIQMRAEGITLQEIANQEGVTRERIRQIESDLKSKLFRDKTICFSEDKYAYIFYTYSLEKSFYSDYLGLSKLTWSYFNFRYTRGKTDPTLALVDKALDIQVRRAIDKYIHRGVVQVDGQYISKQRGVIEEYIVEKYCKDEVTLDEFFKLYRNFLEEFEIIDEDLQLNDSISATRKNRLPESRKILWKQNQRLRYYDIDNGDYEELLETLNLGQYKDIELSTRKFYVDNKALMERYNLHDEYELHNLLKKIHVEKENPDIKFGRMPNIEFGIFDRDQAVRNLLFATAPIAQDDFIEILSREFGALAATIKSNWLGCIVEYYQQGRYEVTNKEMPDEYIIKLKKALTNDFYYITDLHKIYRDLIPDADLTLLSTYNLKKMGFIVGVSYVIQNYSTAEAYFDHLLTCQDITDIGPISRKFTGLTTYSSYLTRLRHEMEIIEFEPFQYINIRRLRKLGFDKNRLKLYGDSVWSFLTNDEFFTIHSLRQSGFQNELDNLGFSDIFYNSLLKEDDRFSWQRINNSVVFNPKKNRFTMQDFLVDRITENKSIDIDTFINDLTDLYGITISRAKIIEEIKGSDVFYDSIMERLYSDYGTFYEEI